MKTKRGILGLLFLAVLLLSGSGCQSTKLAPGGAYTDPVLYHADKTIVSSYKVLHAFVKWEYQNRAVLPVEVSRGADAVRANTDRWVDTAMNLREAYAANPNGDTKSNLDKAIDILLTALSEASKYMLDFEANRGGTLQPQSAPVYSAPPLNVPRMEAPRIGPRTGIPSDPRDPRLQPGATNTAQPRIP